jgi:hypothetical protein
LVGGGAGSSRHASFFLFGNTAFHVFGAYVSGALATITGNGATATFNEVFAPNIFTSDNLVNGTFYLGIGADTDSLDSTLGNGIINFSALNWTFFTGPNVPNPPIDVISGFIDNPAGNTNPGVFAGGQFASLRAVLTQPHNYPGATFAFNTGHSGITFAATGSTGLTVNTESPTWYADTGAINVALTVPPGVYPIYCSMYVGSQNTSVGTSLTVARRLTGMFMEF